MPIKTYLTPKEIDSLIEAADNLRDRLIIRFLFRAGCRVSELLSLRLENIDWGSRMIMIRHLKSLPRKKCPSCGESVGRKARFCPYCGSPPGEVEMREEERFRLITLDQETLEMARKYVDGRSADSELLIPLTRQMVDHIVKQAARKAGLGGEILLNPESGKVHQVSAHRFRDALAMRWLKKKSRDVEGMKALQEHLGHKSFATTMRYAKLEPSQVADVYREVFE